MKINVFVTLLPIFLGFTGVAQATMIVPKPKTCPAVAAITAIGVSRNVQPNGEDLWVAGRRDQQYGTIDDWTFLIGNIPATGIDQAYHEATSALASLAFQKGPLTGPLSKWLCYYTTLQGYTAVTINPPIVSNENMYLMD